MRTDIRECGSTSGFNTGMNYCPLQPDKVAGVILVIHGKKLPKGLTADALEKACHADYPDRIYPITGFSEYAVSGGEPNTSENGYAGSEITGYSARTDTFTLRKFNLALQANLVANKDTLFDMYVFDKNNVIYGEDDGTDELAGFDLSGVYPTGQTYDSSGQKAYLAFNAMYSDTEKMMKNMSVKQSGVNLENVLKGLNYVEFVKMTSSENTYKLVDHYDRTDLTAYYGAVLSGKASTVVSGASALEYSNGVLTATGDVPVLKSPSILQANGVIGIEQWVQ